MIKLFLTDIDGTLTDGTYYCFPDLTQRGKRYHTRDFHGLLLLHEAEITVGVVSRANSEADKKQLRHAAGFAIEGFGVRDKLQFVQERFVDSGLFQWDEIAFIGDDVLDIPLLNAVGLAACPADADPAVIEAILSRQDAFVLGNKGGQACVREFINMILPVVYNEREISNG